MRQRSTLLSTIRRSRHRLLGCGNFSPADLSREPLALAPAWTSLADAQVERGNIEFLF